MFTSVWSAQHLKAGQNIQQQVLHKSVLKANLVQVLWPLYCKVLKNFRAAMTNSIFWLQLKMYESLHEYKVGINLLL